MQLTVLISHKDILLSAEQVVRVLENGRNAASLTESACPLRVDTHAPLQYTLAFILYHTF